MGWAGDLHYLCLSRIYNNLEYVVEAVCLAVLLLHYESELGIAWEVKERLKRVLYQRRSTDVDERLRENELPLWEVPVASGNWDEDVH